MTNATLERTVEQFTQTTHKLFIGGQWVEAASGETFVTPNPATGNDLATVAAGGAEDIDRAVRAARAALGRSSLTSSSAGSPATSTPAVPTAPRCSPAARASVSAATSSSRR
jgi:4-aminobutyrate aminotransferase-like enzyme